MFEQYEFEFQDTATADGLSGMNAMCYAISRVLVKELVSNCSASVDLDSYIATHVAGRPDSLDFVVVRAATLGTTHDPTLWLEDTRERFDAALREFGFYTARSAPTARVASLGYRRTSNLPFFILLAFIVGLTGLLLVRKRRGAPPGGEYARVGV